MAEKCHICELPSSLPSVYLMNDGTCNQCAKHFELARHYPNSREAWQSYIQKIRSGLRDKKTMVGVSGGADSMFTLHLLKEAGLNTVAVHFDDGFAHDKARHNIQHMCTQLGIELVTVRFPLELTRQVKAALLQASVPEVDISYEIGVSSALMTEAYKREIKDIFVGFSFRSEGILPLEWNYLDGDYFQHLMYRQGVKIPRWKPHEPGYHFGKRQIWFYQLRRGIRFHTPLSHYPYEPEQARQTLQSLYGWQPVQSHEDDPFQSFARWYVKHKFGYDRVLFQQAALRRFGLLANRVEQPTADAKINVMQQLNLDDQTLEKWLKQPPVHAREVYWPRRYMGLLRPVLWILYKTALLSPEYYIKLVR